MALYDAPVPGAPGIGQAALRAKKAYQDALARLNQQRTGALRQYGYAADIDPNTGVLGNLRVDPNNPYGYFQDMMGAAGDEMAAAEDMAAERGLRGGLANQGISRAKFQHGRRSSQLGQGLVGTIAGFQDQQNQAKYLMDSALYEAELEATRRAIDNQDFNPADYSDTEYPDYGDGPAPVKVITDKGPVDTTPGPPKGTVFWAGRNMNASQLVTHLRSQGQDVNQWIRNHPEAARRLGLNAKTIPVAPKPKGTPTRGGQVRKGHISGRGL